MTRLIVLTLAALLLPAGARAQTRPGPLRLEPIENPFVVAPDYRITRLNDDTAQLAGGYAGRLFDNALLVGGAAYWLASGGRGEEMTYGGLLVGWFVPAGPRIRFGGRGLVGLGTATLARELQLAGPVVRSRDGVRAGPGQTVRFLARDDFFVFEPQADAVILLVPHVGVNVSGGYRVTGSTDALEDRLNGATGGVALQLTW